MLRYNESDLITRNSVENYINDLKIVKKYEFLVRGFSLIMNCFYIFVFPIIFCILHFLFLFVITIFVYSFLFILSDFFSLFFRKYSLSFSLFSSRYS